jgi:hypothetical protein
MTIPRPPASAGPAGRRLWRAVLSEYSLTGADLEVLRQAVLIADELDGLESLVRAGGPLIRNRDGEPVANPASVQHRLLSVCLGRLLACIRVIADEAPGEAGTRLQHRSGFRGPYSGLKAVP